MLGFLSILQAAAGAAVRKLSAKQAAQGFFMCDAEGLLGLAPSCSKFSPIFSVVAILFSDSIVFGRDVIYSGTQETFISLGTTCLSGEDISQTDLLTSSFPFELSILFFLSLVVASCADALFVDDNYSASL